MLPASAATAWLAYDGARAARLLRDAAMPGDAEIVRRFTAPNGFTRRIEYRVTGADGTSAMRNAEVDPVLWEALAGVATVQVRYVPDDPSISRLAVGEIERGDPLQRPGANYVPSAVCAIMSILLLTIAALQWRGWDLDLDSRTHKFSIKRFGEGR
jgi:hypothetical protein